MVQKSEFRNLKAARSFARSQTPYFAKASQTSTVSMPPAIATLES